MNASSESGLWATWIVVISSLRGGAHRGERGVDVVLVKQVLGEPGRAFGRSRRDEASIERTGARFILLQPCDTRAEDQTEEMRRALLEDGVRLRPRERGVAGDFARAAEIIPLIEVQRVEHLVGGARHRHEGADGVLSPGLVLRHDAVIEALGPLLGSELADVGWPRHRAGGCTRGARRFAGWRGADWRRALHVRAIEHISRRRG